VRPVAKGKKRAADAQADADALAEFEKQQLVPVKQEPMKKPRHGVTTGEIVNIMADEIQAVYREMGATIDEVNARDKALTLWRELSIYGHVVAQEHEVEHVLCEKHV